DPILLDYPRDAPAFEWGARNHRLDHPFINNPMPDKPSLCEVALSIQPFGAGVPTPLGTFCASDAIKAGPCPPNPSHPPDSRRPTTLDELTVSFVPATDLFPETMLYSYVVTAHAAMTPGSRAHMVIDCGTRPDGIGHRTDDVFHSELGGLHAGESF